MAINATNYDGTKDYKIAELGDVYHPNLLINGDFQVNQRGKSSYTSASSTPTYTVDMWKLSNGTLKVLTNGIQLSSTSTQKAKIEQRLKGNDVNYIVQFSVDGETKSFKRTKGQAQSSYQFGVVGVLVAYANGYLTVSITVNQSNSENIEYISLYEVTSELNHVKEDHATALLRCQRYFYRTPERILSLVTPTGALAFMNGFDFPTEMASKPTATMEVLNTMRNEDFKEHFKSFAVTKTGVRYIQVDNSTNEKGLEYTASFSCEP